MADAEFISVQCLPGPQDEVFCGDPNLSDAGGIEWRIILDHVISDFLRNGRIHFTQHRRWLHDPIEAIFRSVQSTRYSAAQLVRIGRAFLTAY
jgi:hypothetical protein